MSNLDKIRQEIERRRLHFNKEAEKYQALNNGYSQNCYGARDALRDLENFLGSLTDESENHGCGVEFPHFGANYPDAKCIDGYLWDMDSYEDGVYTIGGDDPCPICNTEKWLKDVLDDEIFKTRDEALEYVKMLKSKYKHKDSLQEEKPSEDLEEAVISIWKCRADGDASQLVLFSYDEVVALMRTGAKWQKGQMLKEAVEGKVVELRETYKDLSISVGAKELNEVLQPLGVKDGDKVKVIIVKGAEK